jgi:hypothetical protein
MSCMNAFTHPTGNEPWPLACEHKHRHLLTRRNASIAPLTLAFGVIACRMLPSGCRVFAACSPPAVARLGDPSLLDPAWTFAMSFEESVTRESIDGAIDR